MREFLQQKKRECGMIAGLRDHVVGKLDAIWARMGFEEPEIMDRLRYDFKFSKKNNYSPVFEIRVKCDKIYINKKKAF